jgi:hypothetical protein
VEEGGYESIGLITDIGFFAAEAQDVVAAAIRKLAEKNGRPLPDRKSQANSPQNIVDIPKGNL